MNSSGRVEVFLKLLVRETGTRNYINHKEQKNSFTNRRIINCKVNKHTQHVNCTLQKEQVYGNLTQPHFGGEGQLQLQSTLVVGTQSRNIDCEMNNTCSDQNEGGKNALHNTRRLHVKM